jgi:hypothetical protein
MGLFLFHIVLHILLVPSQSKRKRAREQIKDFENAIGSEDLKIEISGDDINKSKIS